MAPGSRDPQGKHGDTVVTQAAVAAYNKRFKALQDTNGGRKPNELQGIMPADLTFVAMISVDKCFLKPDGYWNGAKGYTATLADVKLSCKLEAPHDTLFAGDFPMVIKNLELLTKMVANEGHNPIGIFDWKEQSKQTFKVGHVLFEEKGDGDVDDPDLKEWPVDSKSTIAKEALRNMEKTHIVQELAAYDIYGDPIPPSEYMRALRGAVVRVTISLRHWKIDRRSQDVYRADIVSFSVIRAATPAVIQGRPSNKGSPAKKRRVPSVDPCLDAEAKTPKKARLG